MTDTTAVTPDLPLSSHHHHDRLLTLQETEQILKECRRTLASQRDTFKRHIDNGRKAFAKRVLELQQVQDQLEQANKKIASLQADRSYLEAQNEALRVQLSTSKQEQQQQQQQQQESTSSTDVAEQKEELTFLRNQLVNLTRQAKKDFDHSKFYKASVRDLRTANINQRTEINQLKQEIARLKHQKRYNK